MELDRENPLPLSRLRGGPDVHWQDWSPELETAYLEQLAGVERLEDAASLQLVVNTVAGGTIDHLGGTLPNLQELNLNGSMLDSLRDLGTGFRLLQVLWVSRCGLKDLDGLNGLPSLRELYAAYNDIADLQPVDACQHLEVLDVECNCIADADNVLYLVSCTNLQTLSLAGNPAAEQPDYRRTVCAALPSLQCLDDEPVTSADRDPQHPQHDGSTGMGSVAASGAVLSGFNWVVTAPSSSAAGPSSLPLPPLRAAAAAAAVSTSSAAFDSPSDTAASTLTAAAHASSSAASTSRTGTPGAPADAEEVALVVAGIKHARVGVDSHEFREIEMNLLVATADGTDVQLDVRPGSSTLLPASASTWVRTLRSSREGSLAALRASHAAAASARTGSQSSGSPCSASPISSRPPSAPHQQQQQQQQRSPALSQHQQQPQQQERWAVLTGAGAALGMSLGFGGGGMRGHGSWTGNGGMGAGGYGGMVTAESPRRPGSGGYRLGTPGSAGRPFSARPGTSASFSARVSTSASTGTAPSSATVGLYWAKNRIGASGANGAGGGNVDTGACSGHGGTASSDDAEGAVCSSKLTQGSDTTFGASLARDLRKWKGAAVRAAAASTSAGGADASGDAPAAEGPTGHCGGGNALSQTLLRGGQLDPKALLEELKRWKLETADRVLFVDPDEAPVEGCWAGSEGPELAAGGGGGMGMGGGHRPDVLSLSSSHDVAASSELGGVLGVGIGLGLGLLEPGPEPGMSPMVPSSPLQPPRPPAGAAAAVRRKMVLAKVLRDVAADSIGSSGASISEILAGLRPVHSPAGFMVGSPHHKPGIAWGAPLGNGDMHERDGEHRASASPASQHQRHQQQHHHHQHASAAAQQQHQQQQRSHRPSSARSTCSSSGQSDYGHTCSYSSRPGSREEEGSTAMSAGIGSSYTQQHSSSSLQRQKSGSRAPGIPVGPSGHAGMYKVMSVAGEVDVRSSNPNPVVRLGHG
ncbi:hypothetical protein Agub_g205 [Astrephomene gubernaculifera]|uniref:Leucine-rich repeat-containing protein 56 n=1 Tax=Astrephomene gubernaculifera TaxID=47775 RepID=A0AAD3HFU9_9CHLO|nr:hypothetical protein Agub_g205 [Astrephomene gubernaculifera]